MAWRINPKKHYEDTKRWLNISVANAHTEEELRQFAGLFGQEEEKISEEELNDGIQFYKDE